MRARTRVLTVALAAGLALTTTGCGGGGGGNALVTDENRPYVDALAESMVESGSEDDLPLSDDQAACMAPRFVNIIGVDRLEDKGISAEDFANDDSMDFSNLEITEKDGNSLYDTFGECDVNLREIMLEGFAQDETMTPEMVTCMEGVFTDDNLRKLMVSSMVKGDDSVDEDPELSPLMSQLMGCAFLGLGEDG